MSDLELAGLLIALLVALAIAAPIWGVDSREGFEGSRPGRRLAWLRDD